MIIDCHAHLEEEISAERKIEIMDHDGVDKSVVFGGVIEQISSTPDLLLAFFRFLLQSPLNPLGRKVYNSYVNNGILTTSGKQHRIFREPDNDPVGQASLKHPDRFIFFAFINPRGSRDPLDVLKMCRKKYKVQGVKAHAWFHELDLSKDLHAVGACCQEWNLPLLIHLGGNQKTGNIQALVDAYPRLNIILAHLGVPYFNHIWPLVKKHPNLYMDISGPYLNAKMVAKAVRDVGIRKILFGTDAPYGLRTGNGHSYKPLRLWTEQLSIPDREKEDIFSGNLLRLLPG